LHVNLFYAFTIVHHSVTKPQPKDIRRCFCLYSNNLCDVRLSPRRSLSVFAVSRIVTYYTRNFNVAVETQNLASLHSSFWFFLCNADRVERMDILCFKAFVIQITKPVMESPANINGIFNFTYSNLVKSPEISLISSSLERCFRYSLRFLRLISFTAISRLDF